MGSDRSLSTAFPYNFCKISAEFLFCCADSFFQCPPSPQTQEKQANLVFLGLFPNFPNFPFPFPGNEKSKEIFNHVHCLFCLLGLGGFASIVPQELTFFSGTHVFSVFAANSLSFRDFFEFPHFPFFGRARFRGIGPPAQGSLFLPLLPSQTHCHPSRQPNAPENASMQVSFCGGLPPKAIWWRITEDSIRKMDWHSDVQTRKRQWIKRSQLQLDRRKQRPLEGKILCDPWFFHSRPPYFKFASFCFFSVSGFLSAIRWLEGTDPKHTHTHTHTRKIGQNDPKKSDQPFRDKAESGDYSSQK